MFEENATNAFVFEHPSLDFAKSWLELVPLQKFWTISSFYPDQVCRLHVQIRLMGNFGLNTPIAQFASSAKKVMGIILLPIVRVFRSILTYFDQI